MGGTEMIPAPNGFPDSNVHGVNMGSCLPPVGPMLAP